MNKKILFLVIVFVFMFFLGDIYILNIIDKNTNELHRISESHNIAVFRADLLIGVMKIQNNIKFKDILHVKETEFSLDDKLMTKAVEKCMTCHHSPAIRKAIEDLKSQIERYHEKTTLIFNAPPKSVVPEEQKVVALNLGDALVKKIEHIIVQTSAHLKENEKITLSMINYRKNLLLFIVIVGPFFMMGIGFILIRGITKPVNTLLNATRRLKAGDLDFQIEGLKDEFRELAESFNEMAGSLKGQMQDMQRTEQLLIQSNDSLESLIEGIMDPMLTTDKKGFVTYINKGLTAILGYEKEYVIGKHISLLYPGGIEDARKMMRLLKERGIVRNYEINFVKKEGNLLPSLASVALLRDKSGEVIGTLGICKDITERKRIENELKKTKDFLENVVEGSIDAIMVSDIRGIVTFINKAIKDIAGYEPRDITGTRVWKYYEGGIDEARKIKSILIEKGKLEDYESVFIGREGQFISVNISGSLLKNEKGEIIGTLGIFKDITEKKRLKKELEKLSITDNLTGLYNQRHFYNELTREVERAKRLNHPLSLLLFDVDNFKHYNDTYGHLEGDNVLRKLGEIVLKSIRGNVDSGYRYGGDEFTLILPEADREQALSVADRIRVAFNNAGLTGVTLSIGLTEYRTEYDLETFVRHADKAMYTAKQSGGDRISVYE